MAGGWLRGGSFFATPPRRRLGDYVALVVVNPTRADDLAYYDEAVEFGLALIVDVSVTGATRNGSQIEPISVSAITRNCLSLATIVTTRSSAEAEDLTKLVAPHIPVLSLGIPSEEEVDTAQLVDAFKWDLYGARLRVSLSLLPQILLSPRSPLAAPRRIFNMARSIPLSWWFTRVPFAVARRIGMRFKLLNSRASRVLPEVGRVQAPSAEQIGVAIVQDTHVCGLSSSCCDRATSTREWTSVVEKAILEAAAAPATNAPPRVKLLVLMDLIQDLDVVLPIVDRMLSDRRFALTIAITDWLDKVSPRVSRELIARSIVPVVITKKDAIEGLEPDLDRTSALITACETNHPAHRVTHAVVRRAKSRDIPTYTLQHGLENIGLTYFEPMPDHTGPIEMASSTIFTWGPVEALPAEVTPNMRARCFAVGTPKPMKPLQVDLPVHKSLGPVVGVFENLHWERYTDSYRMAFIKDLCLVASARPDTMFLLKPHHAGMYLVKNSHLLADAPSNVVLADPSMPTWEPFTAGQIISSVDAVITTPSTVALDAARADRAVAVVGYGMALPVYEPLSILADTGTWLSFIDEVSVSSTALQSRLNTFRLRHVIEGDAVGRILDKIALDVGSARHRKWQGAKHYGG